MHTSSTLRLTFLPALAVMSGHLVSLPNGSDGEILEIHQPDGKKGDVTLVLTDGTRQTLRSRDPVKLLKPFVVSDASFGIDKDKLMLLRVLENANCAGGLVMDDNADVRFFNHDDSGADDWPDLANTVESIYDHLLACDTLYATLVIQSEE